LPTALAVSIEIAVVDDAANVRFHGGPEVIAGQRGEHFGVGDVLEVDVVLSDERLTERGWDENARRKVGVFE
jgi:hypothetical protein